jgi:enoyl-CoA hydratase/carnithine racemase
MTEPTVLVERTDDILTITLNRPHRLNALTPELQGAFADAFRACRVPVISRVHGYAMAEVPGSH